MPLAPRRQFSPLGQAIIEALDRAAALEVRRRVLQSALDEAGLAEVPERLEDATFFVSGPLYEHAQKALGVDFADSLLMHIAPVLDRVWEDDRADSASGDSFPGDTAGRSEDTPRIGSLPPASAFRTRSRSAIRRLQEDERVTIADSVADTEPPQCGAEGSQDGPDPELREAEGSQDGPSPELRGAEGSQDGPHPGEPQRWPVAEASPDSKRATMPYMEAVIQGESAPRVLVADRDDTRRQAIAARLEEAGYRVVCATDARVAHLLLVRVRPAMVIADVETVAPDFEPLRPALEELFGEAALAPVMLLSDERRPDTPDMVRAIVSPLCPVDELAEAVDCVLRPSA